MTRKNSFFFSEDGLFLRHFVGDNISLRAVCQVHLWAHFHWVFRPSATVSQIGLMESHLCHCRGGPPPPHPLAGYPPPPKVVLDEAGSLMESCLCHYGGPPPGWLPPACDEAGSLMDSCLCLAEDPPGWLTPLAWHENVMDGWGAWPLRWPSVLVLSALHLLAERPKSQLSLFVIVLRIVMDSSPSNTDNLSIKLKPNRWWRDTAQRRCWFTPLFLQEVEIKAAYEQKLQQTLVEKGQEMALAIEERDLQKMAALSQQDSEKDNLQQVITRQQEVPLSFKLRGHILVQIQERKTHNKIPPPQTQTKQNRRVYVFLCRSEEGTTVSSMPLTSHTWDFWLFRKRKFLTHTVQVVHERPSISSRVFPNWRSN